MWSNRKNVSRVHYSVSCIFNIEISLVEFSKNSGRIRFGLQTQFFQSDFHFLFRYLFEVSAYERHIELAILSMVHCDLTNLIWS